MRIDSLAKYEEFKALGKDDNEAKLLARSFAEAADLDLDIVLRPELELMIKNLGKLFHKDIQHINSTMHKFGGAIMLLIIADIVKGFWLR